MIDYGVDNQIGFRQDYGSYLAECRAVFDALAKWTKDDGSLWVVADTLTLPTTNKGQGALVPLPFDLARVASEVGWTLREVIVWRKDRTRPWAAKGKLRNGFEYILVLARSSSYKFNVDRLRDHRSLKSWWIKYPERHNPWGMTPDNVWEIPIPIQGSWASESLRHACPFPVELVRRMIELSTDAGDVVFDPFAGSGVVVAVAGEHGRKGLGTELNPAFVDAFHSQILPEVRAELASPGDLQSSSAMVEKLLKLRLLKYAKELLRALLRAGVKRDTLRGALLVVGELPVEARDSPYATGRLSVLTGGKLGPKELRALQSAIDDAVRRPPLSKFSLSVSVGINDSEQLSGPAHLYRNGRTWRLAGSVVSLDLSDYLDDDFPPIVSNTEIDIRLEE